MFDSSRIAEPLLRKCHDYWRSKCPPDGPPARRDIDPVEMVEFPPNVILVNTASVVGDFTFRLFGTGVVFGFGEDRTGKRFGDLGTMANFDEAIESYWQCYRGVRPVYLRDRPVASEQISSYSRLILPLSADGTVVDMLLACVEFSYSTQAASPFKKARYIGRESGHARRGAPTGPP